MAKMTMTYEFITPEIASKMLEKNQNNRTLSRSTYVSYMQDMLSGNWNEKVGSAISFDENGILRDGQHRLIAVVKSGVGIHSWVCRNVSHDGIYDNNRKRSNSDQVAIICPEFEGIYKSSRFIPVARAIIAHNKQLSVSTRRVVTPNEIIDFIESNKKDLDGYFLKMPQRSIPKISTTVVHLALFMAYMDGVDMDKIMKFYEVLCTGMSERPEELPIIALRNYLQESTDWQVNDKNLSRIQWALKKYLSGSCAKMTKVPKELIYPYPFQKLA